MPNFVAVSLRSPLRVRLVAAAQTCKGSTAFGKPSTDATREESFAGGRRFLVSGSRAPLPMAFP